MAVIAPSMGSRVDNDSFHAGNLFATQYGDKIDNTMTTVIHINQQTILSLLQSLLEHEADTASSTRTLLASTLVRYDRTEKQSYF